MSQGGKADQFERHPEGGYIGHAFTFANKLGMQVVVICPSEGDLITYTDVLCKEKKPDPAKFQRVRISKP